MHDGGGGYGAIDHIERNACGHVAFLAKRLTNGRQRGDAASCDLVVIEAHDRNVFGYANSCFVECGDNAGCDTVRSA